MAAKGSEPLLGQQDTKNPLLQKILYPDSKVVIVLLVLYNIFSYAVIFLCPTVDVDFSCMLSEFVANKDNKNITGYDLAPDGGLYHPMISFSATIYENGYLQVGNALWLALLLHWSSQDLDMTDDAVGLCECFGPYYKGLVIGSLFMWTFVFNTGHQPDHGAWVSVMAGFILGGIVYKIVCHCRDRTHSGSPVLVQVVLFALSAGAFAYVMNITEDPAMRKPDQPSITYALVQVTGINAVLWAFFFTMKGNHVVKPVQPQRAFSSMLFKGALAFVLMVSFFNPAGLLSGFTNTKHFFDFPDMSVGKFDSCWKADTEYKLAYNISGSQWNTKDLVKSSAAMDKVCVAFNADNNCTPAGVGWNSKAINAEAKDMEIFRPIPTLWDLLAILILIKCAILTEWEFCDQPLLCMVLPVTALYLGGMAYAHGDDFHELLSPFK